MNRARIRAIARAAWTYALRTLERPAAIPAVLHSVVIRRAHLGETLNATRFARWLREQGITTVIDVGAHQGEFISGIRAVLPRITSHSFEPQPDAFAVLEQRVRRHTLAYAYPVALGSTTGRRSFHRSRFTKASSILPMSALHRDAFEWTDGGMAIEVEVDTLDNVLSLEGAGSVLLKLDVQGYELEVLKGGARSLEAIDYVLVETSVGGQLYEGEADFDAVYRLLTGAGFRYAGTWDQMRDPRNDTPLQLDALFVRRSAQVP